MNYSHFIGLDLGKVSFDATILTKEGTELSHSQFENSPKGLHELIKWLKSLKVKLSSTLFCAENMGSYTSHLCLYSSEKNLPLSLACPLTIKRSLGITRGKNDKIDSFRIAQFAHTHYRKLKLYSLPEHVLSKLKGWITLREHTVKQKCGLSTILDGFEYEKKITATPELISYTKRKITKLEKEIKELETQMSATIESNESVNKNYKLLTSVVGIGKIVASSLLCSTGNFTKFETHRKFACYCGTAPFEYSSGISVRGKTKVSSIGTSIVRRTPCANLLRKKLRNNLFATFCKKELMETTITIKEFLSNPKDYLDMAEKTAIILTGKKNHRFQLTFCNEDEVLEKYQEKLDMCVEQARNGETVTIGSGTFEEFDKFYSSKKK